MKRYRITLDGTTFDVKVLGDPRREQVQVEVNGEIFIVGVEAVPVMEDVVTEGVSPTAAPQPVRPVLVPTDIVGTGTNEMIAAPLPGVIKAIAVRSGQKVAPDDELLVIEAMKMDNVIRAPRVGTIGTIFATEGRQVSYGEPLLELTAGI